LIDNLITDLATEGCAHLGIRPLLWQQATDLILLQDADLGLRELPAIPAGPLEAEDVSIFNGVSKCIQDYAIVINVESFPAIDQVLLASRFVDLQN
jgi:hypothetical protein